MALSSASPNIARRLFQAIGRPDLENDPDYADPISRQRNAVALDVIVSGWIEERTLSEVMGVFEQAEVAAAPVYDAPQLLADEHQQSRGTFVTMDDPDLGTMTVQAPVAQLSESPGGIDYLGRTLGADNDAVFGGLLGLNTERLTALRSAGTI